jgi:nucleotide-binding universal stress UspA family protein
MTNAHADTVLVALDGSGRSRDALALGQLFAEVRAARLLMAYVHPYGEVPNLLGHASVVRTVVDSIFADSKAILSPGGAREVKIAVHRSPVAGLRRLAREETASMVVVGSSARSRMGQIVAGRTAGRLLSDASLPVAIAPHGYADRERGIDLVGCAFDGRPESRAALKWVAAVARGRSSRLVVFTVRDAVRAGRGIRRRTSRKGDEAVREQRERAVGETLAGVASDGAVDVVWLGGDPQPAVGQRSWALDLLVLGVPGQGGLRARLLGDEPGGLARAANCPLVLVPADTHDVPGRADVERPSARNTHAAAAAS